MSISIGALFSILFSFLFGFHCFCIFVNLTGVYSEMIWFRSFYCAFIQFKYETSLEDTFQRIGDEFHIQFYQVNICILPKYCLITSCIFFFTDCVSVMWKFTINTLKNNSKLDGINLKTKWLIWIIFLTWNHKPHLKNIKYYLLM